MCIYYKDRKDLNYNTGEHIFPAGLGGKLELNKGIVSDEFNNDISKIELHFMREGLVSAPRAITGPGKRGSLQNKDATKSKVHLISDVKNELSYSIGFTQLGKVLEIPQIIWNTQTGVIGFSCPAMEIDKALETIEIFKQKCINADTLKLKIVNEKRLPRDQVILGIKDGIEQNFNAFFFRHSNNPFSINIDTIKKIGASLSFQNSPIHTQYMPKAHMSLIHKEEHLRVYGKIAFNFLCYLKGANILKQKKFDSVRNWIAFGKEYEYVKVDSSNGNPLLAMGIEVPFDSHIVFLTKNGNQTLAKVFLYGGFSVEIILSNDWVGSFRTDGLICDWKNKKEYRLNEFLASKLGV